MVFFKPPHPPVPQGFYPCPECDWAPGSMSAYAEVESDGYDRLGEPFGYEQIEVPCDFCDGKAYVADRRHHPDRRQRGERRQV